MNQKIKDQTVKGRGSIKNSYKKWSMKVEDEHEEG